MYIWIIIISIVVAGMLGGVLNALLSDSGFIWPGSYPVGDTGQTVWKPGALGNVILGGAASFISWGLYGPFAEYTLAPLGSPSTGGPILTISTLVGAFVAGIAGSKLITSEVDKRVLSETASTVATKNADNALAANIATASTPTEALAAAVRAE